MSPIDFFCHRTTGEANESDSGVAVPGHRKALSASRAPTPTRLLKEQLRPELRQLGLEGAKVVVCRLQ